MYCIAVCLFAFTFTVPSPILLCLVDNEDVSTFIALVHIYIPACIYTVPKSCLIKLIIVKLMCNVGTCRIEATALLD